jgi:endogenous inhibitor of DNA gyrase (YacG/DUF329 family)
MARTPELRAEAKAAAAAARKTCAICGKPRDPRYDPFCSKRCADVDLHKWLSGVYVVPGGAAPPDRSEDEAD